MRQHFYAFAHKILPHDVHEEARLWDIISGDRAASYLTARWAEAGGTKADKGLIWIEPVRTGGAEVRVIRMPPPKDLTETFYAAIVRTAGGALRYFVAEQGAAAVNLAEWRSPSERIKYGPLDENAAPPALEAVAPAAAPWEVARDAIPGLPYLGSFLDGIRETLSPSPAARSIPVTRLSGARVVMPPARKNSVAVQALVVLLALIVGIVVFVLLQHR